MVVYQPIISLATGRLCGFEALIRSPSSERVAISDRRLLPCKSRMMCRSINELGLKERALTQMQRNGQLVFPTEPPAFMCVNLSVKQFSQVDLIEKVASILQETNLAPTSLKLEITESAVMENVETATKMLNELRELGVQLAMDDFGTGLLFTL